MEHTDRRIELTPVNRGDLIARVRQLAATKRMGSASPSQSCLRTPNGQFCGVDGGVELGDDELFPCRVGREQGLVEFGPAGEFPRRGVKEHLLAAGRAQGVVLGLGC